MWGSGAARAWKSEMPTFKNQKQYSEREKTVFWPQKKYFGAGVSGLEREKVGLWRGLQHEIGGFRGWFVAGYNPGVLAERLAFGLAAVNRPWAATKRLEDKTFWKWWSLERQKLWNGDALERIFSVICENDMLWSGNLGLKMGVSKMAHTQYAHGSAPPPPLGPQPFIFMVPLHKMENGKQHKLQNKKAVYLVA